MQLFGMALFQIAFFVYVAMFVNNAEVTIEYAAIGNALQSTAYVSVFAVCNITGEEKNQGKGEVEGPPQGGGEEEEGRRRRQEEGEESGEQKQGEPKERIPEGASPLLLQEEGKG